MDLLRSCYSTRARLFRDNTTETTIRWYFTEPGARILPYPCAISSRNWDPETTLYPVGKPGLPSTNGREVGEVPGAARPYSKGENVMGFTGRSVPAEAQDFAEGQLFRLLVPLSTCRDISGTIHWSGQVARSFTGCSIKVPGACGTAPCLLYASVSGDMLQFNTPHYQLYGSPPDIPDYDNANLTFPGSIGVGFETDSGDPNYLHWIAAFFCAGSTLNTCKSAWLPETCDYVLSFDIPITFPIPCGASGNVHVTVSPAPDGVPGKATVLWSGAGTGVGGPPTVNGATVLWSGAGTGH